MTITQFEHITTLHIPDPDFMPIFLQAVGKDHVIALQTWCAFIFDIEAESVTRVDYPAWAWNVGSIPEPEPSLSIFFELRKTLERCPLNLATGKIGKGEVITDQVRQPSAAPPLLVSGEAIWLARPGMGHKLVAVRYDRMTDLAEDISKISQTDFFLPGPDGKVYLHRWDVGLMLPHAGDQPELVVNYRATGCHEPRGVAFDENGKLWILDENGPKLFEIDMSDRGNPKIHDLSELHREVADPTDPSPYPWHSCIWCRGNLVVGCCDAARIDVLKPK